MGALFSQFLFQYMANSMGGWVGKRGTLLISAPNLWGTGPPVFFKNFSGLQFSAVVVSASAP